MCMCVFINGGAPYIVRGIVDSIRSIAVVSYAHFLFWLQDMEDLLITPSLGSMHSSGSGGRSGGSSMRTAGQATGEGDVQPLAGVGRENGGMWDEGRG
jgi:hypothetical protein